VAAVLVAVVPSRIGTAASGKSRGDLRGRQSLLRQCERRTEAILRRSVADE
jgi:hypothetical protein